MDPDPYCRRFCFVHESGDRLYAYRVRNNDTEGLAFRVSDQRVIKDLEREIEDENEMMRLVLELNYQVRMSTLPGTKKRHGGYRRHGRSIIRVERFDDGWVLPTGLEQEKTARGWLDRATPAP